MDLKVFNNEKIHIFMLEKGEICGNLLKFIVQKKLLTKRD